MSKYLFRQWKIQCHQEDRPVNGMETDDIFTDQMKVCRPVFLEQVRRITICIVTDFCDIVCQRIKPYINNVLRIKIYRNTPAEGCSGYTQILQSRKQEVVHHLIFSGNRLNELRMSVDVVDEAVSVFAHFEEICFLLSRLNLTTAVRAFAVYQLRLCEERLTRCAVHSFVISFVNISLIVQFFEDFLYLFLMILIRCTDEVVIRSIHQIPDTFYFSGSFVNILLRCNAGCLCL